MSVKTHNKTKLVPVNRSVALLPERDAAISPILECIDLGVTFGGLKAVDNFDITIGRTEIAGLIGPNGAGKTTIFNLLTKVYQPTHGTILLDGKDIHGMTTAQVNRAGIARTFQNIRLFSELTVEENITVAMSSQIKYNMASGIFRLPSFWKGERIAHERAMELLSIFHMEQFANAKAGSLPYGAQRRLEILRALATNPCLLLLAMFCNALASLVGLIAYLEQKARFVREKKKPVLVGLCVLAWCASLLGFGEIIAVVYPIFGYLSIVFIVCMVVHFVQCRKKEKASA